MYAAYLLVLEWFGSDGETHSVHRLLEISWHSKGLNIGRPFHYACILKRLYNRSTAVCT